MSILVRDYAYSNILPMFPSQSRLQSHFCTTVPPLLNSDISPRTFPISFNSALGNVVINANSRPWL